MTRPYRVGLTGGIGSGKSVVATMFAGHGVPVIDADTISHDLTRPGKPALRQIAGIFGKEILDPSGNLRRDVLRNIVFSEDVLRRKLESILHPLVYEAMADQVRQIDAGYCILTIPLLLETGAAGRVDTVLVIDTPVSLQIDRVCKRDGLSRKQAEGIINSQISREDRLKHANEVIINDGDLGNLAARVNELHVKYSTRANKPTTAG
jgi:dephospho-CoA kinase